MLPISTLEHWLTRQGYFSLFDWLLEENHLAFSDYEAWREQRLDVLDGHFGLEEEVLSRLIADCEHHALALKLRATEVAYQPWRQGAADAGPLRISRLPQRHQALTLRWERPQDLPQLDLFMDNSALVAEHALAAALADRNWSQADIELQRLTCLNPDHRALGGFSDLLNYGRYCDAEPQIDPEQLDAELNGLEQEVAPLARELLPVQGRDYLSHAWRRLGASLQGYPFDTARPRRHLSHALRQIPDWDALEQCLLAEPQLHRQPLLLQRLIECHNASHRQADALALWCQLFDRYPEEAESAIEACSDTPGFQAWQDFWEQEQDWHAKEFASYLLIEQPGLLSHVECLPGSRSAELETVMELLRTRHQDDTQIRVRKRLQQLSPSLFRHYLDCIRRTIG